MKNLKQYLTERLIIKKKSSIYIPETKEELQAIIKQRIKQEGNEVDLNDIDVSNITDMSELFMYFSKFNGDISNWDVPKVKNSKGIFICCPIEEKYKPKFK